MCKKDEGEAGGDEGRGRRMKDGVVEVRCEGGREGGKKGEQQDQEAGST